MVRLSKKKLIANIFLSSMLLAQTVPTFANVLEVNEAISHTIVEKEAMEEEINQEASEQMIGDQLPLSEETSEMAIDPLFSGGGNGSVSSPFQITTEAELNEIRNDLTAHYHLMNDITLTSDWIPVGYGATLATKFTGSLTAEPGTVIRNMRVTSGAQAGDTGNRGFFGVTDGARISGITLENPQVSGGLNGEAIGGLIGRINDVNSKPTTVTDSAVVGGRIEASGGYVGGLVGSMVNRLHGTAVIRSSSSATVTVNRDLNDSPQAVGGLIGIQHIYSTVIDSYATGDVVGITGVGGFIGGIHSLAEPVGRSYSTGSVVGVANVGGFVGDAEYSEVQNSYAMGDVTGESNVDHFGFNSTNLHNYYYNHSKVLNNGVYVEGPVTPDVIEPLDVIELRTRNTYESNGWDFDSIWVWDTETNYPKLGLGSEVDTLPIDALGETVQVPYGGVETRISLSNAFSVFGRGGNPDDYLFGTDADGISVSEDGRYLILEITSIGTYEITATPIRRLTTLEPGQNWNKAIIEVVPAEILLEKGTVFARGFNGTTEIDHFAAPTLMGLAPGEDVIWLEESFRYTDSITGTDTIIGENWALDWGAIDLSNYDFTKLPTMENDAYRIVDIFDVEAITKAAGAFLRIDEELAAQNNTHEVITIAGTALLHHDDTPDTPGEQWYHDHVEELLQDVTFLIYDTNPQVNPLARVVTYADGIAAVDGAFAGLNANTTYWITAISDESTNFSQGEESEPIMLNTALSGGNGGGGNNGNGGTGGNTGNNGGGPSGNNQPGTTPSGNPAGSGNGNIATNAASTRSSGRGDKLPNTGEVASTFALLGFGAVGTALASWLKRKKNN
ncbi:hypothetical protein C6P52_00010 [Enterococcus mundtii]|uniref:LPXTG cell wall anchor domain-containing protein n=1 Tax=Enterococcus mundtii TaxID=53346 RepID=UPI000D364F9B|nr:LPXTG cell wall anchor domain-containing protein [Enterococcus mundtii]PTO40327.1 hypothetical protein C6P52_00010 [Enterococcus mundtii]PTO45106.1 hypothetical protein C6P54_01080 [Enterococcus mundtii]